MTPRASAGLRRHPLFVFGLLLLGATISAACGRPQPGGSARSTADLRASVESATVAFHQALRTNDTTAMFTYVADDVLMMPPSEGPVRGQAAMRAWMASFLAQYHTSSLILTDREVFVGDAWASELGSYEWGLTPVAGGAPVLDRGHYMQIWKQLPDGRWRFAREIWNSSLPPASSAVH